mgnify:CR=1 FL=1
MTRETIERIASGEDHLNHCEFSPDVVVVKSDPAGGRPVYLHASGSRLRLSENLPALLDSLNQSGELEIIDGCFSHYLQHYAVPLPWSCYRGVWIAGCGDRLEARLDSTGIWRVNRSIDFPFALTKSRQDSDPSTSGLGEVLRDSVDAALTGASGKALFLSGGKDSIPLAIAAADAGHSDLLCVTYGSTSGADETEVARKVAGTLGLRHHAFDVRIDPNTTSDAIIRYFEGAPIPNVDFAALSYPVMAAHLDLAGYTVLDGMGNDVFIGHVPPAAVEAKKRRRLPEALQRAGRAIYPSDLPLSNLLRTEAQLDSLRGCFFPREEARFNPNTLDTFPFWSDALDKARAYPDPFDRRAFLRGRYLDQETFMRKVRNAADAFGWALRFPWCDPVVVDHVFNLPEAFRFDRTYSKNKVLIRSHIRERVGIDSDAVGKNVFGFDYVEILRVCQDLVLSEIASCPAWKPGAAAYAERLYAEGLEHRDNAKRLYCMFMLSGWRNHCRHLRA